MDLKIIQSRLKRKGFKYAEDSRNPMNVRNLLRFNYSGQTRHSNFNVSCFEGRQGDLFQKHFYYAG